MKLRLSTSLLFAVSFFGSAIQADTRLMGSTLSKCMDGSASNASRYQQLLELGWEQPSTKNGRDIHKTFIASYAGVAIKYGSGVVRATERDADDIFSQRYLGKQPKLTGRKPYQLTSTGTYLQHGSSNSFVAVWMVRPSDGTTGSQKRKSQFSCILATDDPQFFGGLAAKASKNPWDPIYHLQMRDEIKGGRVFRRKFELRNHENIRFPQRLARNSPKRYLLISDVSDEPIK